MKQFFALLNVSICSMLVTSTNIGRRKRTRAATGIGAMVLIAFLGLYISGLYSSMLMSVLAPAGLEGLVFTFMGAAALLGGLLFTVFAVRGVVFGGKDNDLLLALPVPDSMLMAARVSAIWLENFVFAFFVLIPAGVACAILTQRGVGHDLLFWLRLVLCALLLPMLDTALSVLLGALAAFVSTKVSKGKALGQNLVMAVFLAAVFWFSFNLNGMLQSLAADPEGVRAGLSWMLPLVWLGDGILGDWGALAGFAACCVVPFAVMIFGLGKVYRKAVTAFQAQSARNDYNLTAQRSAGQTKALLLKEARRFFGTPSYFWNGGIGLIMLLMMAVAAVIFRDDLQDILVLIEMAGMDTLTLLLAAGAIGFCLCTCSIAAPSISLEGKYLWILREAPVGEETLLWLKVGFELLLSLPCALIACVCLTFALGLPLWQGAVLTVAMVLFALGHACFSLLMGLTFPKLDAPNETMVIKQSLATFLAMFVPMAVLGAAGLLWWLGGKVAVWLSLALPVALIAVLAAASAMVLYKRGPVMFRAL